MNVLEFRPFQGFKRGLVAAILQESYAALLAQLPADKADELCRDWNEYDEGVHDEPDTVGASGFITQLDEATIGFGSWDPRGRPRIGCIGHNCILPAFRNCGYGRRQIDHILDLFRGRNFERAQVRTDEHPFFEPARRMYERCGFRFVKREPGTLSPGLDMLVYERPILPAGD